MVKDNKWNFYANFVHAFIHKGAWVRDIIKLEQICLWKILRTFFIFYVRREICVRCSEWQASAETETGVAAEGYADLFRLSTFICSSLDMLHIF